MRPRTKKTKEANSDNIEFVQKRFELLQDDLKCYRAYQEGQKELSLLKFKEIEESSSNNDDDEEEQADIRQKSDQQVKKVGQQIELIHKVVSKVESELTNVESSTKNETDTQLKILEEQQDKFKNISFNMDYQLNESSRDRQRWERQSQFDIEKWFETKQLSRKNSLQILSHLHNQFTSFQKTLQKKDNEIREINFFLQTPLEVVDFFRFDDFIQTVILGTTKTFESIKFIVNFDNNLCILAFLRVLLAIKSYNRISINFGNSRQPQTNQNFAPVRNIIQSIFEIILLNRNLQSLDIKLNHKIFKEFVPAFSKVDPLFSNLNVCNFSGDLRLADTNLFVDCFQFLSKLPKLYHFRTGPVPVSGSGVIEQLNLVFRNVRSLQIDLQSLPKAFNFKFDCSQLIYLKLHFGLEPNVFSDEKLNNLLSCVRDAKQLNTFQLTVYSYIPQDTSRRDILKQAQAKQNQDKSTPEDQTQTCVTPCNQSTEILLFDHLSDLKNLRNFKINLELNQKIFDSLRKLFIRNGYLEKIEMDLMEPTRSQIEQKQKQPIDFSNLYEIIGQFGKCNKFRMNTSFGNLTYHLPTKRSVSYILSSSIFNFSSEGSFNFKPFEFAFKRVQFIDLTISCKDLSLIDMLCQSIVASPSIITIYLTITADQSIQQKVKRQKVVHSELPFFSRLCQLKDLQNLKLDIVVDQHILDSFVPLLRNSLKLKTFIFKRQNICQYYLNYSSLFEAISSSTSLQQIYINSGIEQMSITNETYQPLWQNDKITNFYLPFTQIISQCQPSLYIIDLDENNLNEMGIQGVLSALHQSSHQIYMKLGNEITKKLFSIESGEILEVLKACMEKGQLVNQNFKFPLAQETYQSYFYW